MLPRLSPAAIKWRSFDMLTLFKSVSFISDAIKVRKKIGLTPNT